MAVNKKEFDIFNKYYNYVMRDRGRGSEEPREYLSEDQVASFEANLSEETFSFAFSEYVRRRAKEDGKNDEERGEIVGLWKGYMHDLSGVEGEWWEVGYKSPKDYTPEELDSMLLKQEGRAEEKVKEEVSPAPEEEREYEVPKHDTTAGNTNDAPANPDAGSVETATAEQSEDQEVIFSPTDQEMTGEDDVVYTDEQLMVAMTKGNNYLMNNTFMGKGKWHKSNDDLDFTGKKITASEKIEVTSDGGAKASFYRCKDGKVTISPNGSVVISGEKTKGDLRRMSMGAIVTKFCLEPPQPIVVQSGTEQFRDITEDNLLSLYYDKDGKFNEQARESLIPMLKDRSDLMANELIDLYKHGRGKTVQKVLRKYGITMTDEAIDQAGGISNFMEQYRGELAFRRLAQRNPRHREEILSWMNEESQTYTNAYGAAGNSNTGNSAGGTSNSAENTDTGAGNTGDDQLLTDEDIAKVMIAIGKDPQKAAARFVCDLEREKAGKPAKYYASEKFAALKKFYAADTAAFSDDMKAFKLSIEEYAEKSKKISNELGVDYADILSELDQSTIEKLAQSADKIKGLRASGDEYCKIGADETAKSLGYVLSKMQKGEEGYTEDALCRFLDGVSKEESAARDGNERVGLIAKLEKMPEKSENMKAKTDKEAEAKKDVRSQFEGAFGKDKRSEYEEEAGKAAARKTLEEKERDRLEKLAKLYVKDLVSGRKDAISEELREKLDSMMFPKDKDSEEAIVFKDKVNEEIAKQPEEKENMAKKSLEKVEKEQTAAKEIKDLSDVQKFADQLAHGAPSDGSPALTEERMKELTQKAVTDPKFYRKVLHELKGDDKAKVIAEIKKESEAMEAAEHSTETVEKSKNKSDKGISKLARIFKARKRGGMGGMS